MTNPQSNQRGETETGGIESILSPVLEGSRHSDSSFPVQMTDAETGLPILGNQVFIASSAASGTKQGEAHENAAPSIGEPAAPNTTSVEARPGINTKAGAEKILSAVLEGVSAGLKKDDGGDGSQTGDPAPIVTVSLQNPIDDLPDLPLLGNQVFIGVSSSGDGEQGQGDTSSSETTENSPSPNSEPNMNHMSGIDVESILTPVFVGVSDTLKKDDGGDGTAAGETGPVVAATVRISTDDLPDLPFVGNQVFIAQSPTQEDESAAGDNPAKAPVNLSQNRLSGDDSGQAADATSEAVAIPSTSDVEVVTFTAGVSDSDGNSRTYSGEIQTVDLFDGRKWPEADGRGSAGQMTEEIIIIVPELANTQSSQVNQPVSNPLKLGDVLDTGTDNNDLSATLENLGDASGDAPLDSRQKPLGGDDSGQPSDVTADAVTSLGALESAGLIGGLDPLDLGASVEVFA